MPKRSQGTLALFSDEQLGQKPLLAEEGLRNAAANEIWKRREVDTMLDMYLAGAEPGRIAVTLKRNRKAVVRKLQEYIYNERNRSSDYEPRQRQSRKGKRLTQNENQIIAECRRKGVQWKQIALVLQRDMDEIRVDEEREMGKIAHKQMQGTATSLDLLLAYRYLYYVQHISLISDKAYDDLEAEERELGGGKSVLDKFVGSDKAEDYPPHIRALALYLAFKHGKRKNDH